MTKIELIRKAHFVGRLIIRNRVEHAGGYEIITTVSRELEHYFNEKKEEIGIISFPGTSLEGIHIFNEPRKWAQEFLDGQHIIPLK